jgi:hypothetical protein
LSVALGNAVDELELLHLLVDRQINSYNLMSCVRMKREAEVRDYDRRMNRTCRQEEQWRKQKTQVSAGTSSESEGSRSASPGRPRSNKQVRRHHALYKNDRLYYVMHRVNHHFKDRHRRQRESVQRLRHPYTEIN